MLKLNCSVSDPPYPDADPDPSKNRHPDPGPGGKGEKLFFPPGFFHDSDDSKQVCFSGGVSLWGKKRSIPRCFRPF